MAFSDERLPRSQGTLARPPFRNLGSGTVCPTSDIDSERRLTNGRL